MTLLFVNYATVQVNQYHFKIFIRPTGILNFSQPVYVQRDDRESRRYAILEIIRRVQFDQDWPQVKHIHHTIGIKYITVNFDIIKKCIYVR